VLRDLARRRVAVLILVLVPMAFYVARNDMTGQSIRFASIGLAWAVSTLAVFSGNAGRQIEARLSLSGFRPVQLVAGRTLALVGVGAALAGAYWAIVHVDHGLDRTAFVAVELVVTALVAVQLGLLLSATVGRDLEGALLLCVIAGMQLIADPAQAWTRILPFWSTRELGTYAIDPVGSDYLARGLTHGAVALAVLVGANLVLAAIRLRARPHLVVLAAR
jgi:hypothetical protein